jgi:hypothetical protein
MMLAMTVSTHSHSIDEILETRQQASQRAAMLLDCYFILNSDESREEFVAALVYRLLFEHARRHKFLTVMSAPPIPQVTTHDL